MRSKIDQFDISNASPQKVARGAFRVIDRLQDYQPHEQVMSCAAAFILIAEQCRIENPQDLFTAVKNMLNDEREGGRQQFTAVRNYAQHELSAKLG
jgi:hypothetical protein